MGLILDSSAAIAAERRGDTVQAFLQHVIDAASNQEAALSTVGVVELVHGIYHADTVERRARREAFVEELLATIAIYPLTTEVARLAGKLDTEQQNTIKYYKSVVDGMGGPANASNGVRLFLEPGMGHCGGGEGPNVFDKVGALEQWVEHGKAPETMNASHSTNGKMDRTRPLCPYPQVARYKGTGSIDDAANFACKVP